jgi:uncharacterized protein YuzE
MTTPTYNYDEVSDTLYISFEPGAKATGIELNESILLRVNKQELRVIGITLFNYSYLAQRTESGPRSLPLTGLADLSQDLRTLVLDLLQRLPTTDILAISSYSPSLGENIPVITVLPLMATVDG